MLQSCKVVFLPPSHRLQALRSPFVGGLNNYSVNCRHVLPPDIIVHSLNPSCDSDCSLCHSIKTAHNSWYSRPGTRTPDSDLSSSSAARQGSARGKDLCRVGRLWLALGWKRVAKIQEVHTLTGQCHWKIEACNCKSDWHAGAKWESNFAASSFIESQEEEEQWLTTAFATLYCSPFQHTHEKCSSRFGVMDTRGWCWCFTRRWVVPNSKRNRKSRVKAPDKLWRVHLSRFKCIINARLYECALWRER